MSAGGGYYDKPPVEIATDDITKASDMLKLVNLDADDYVLDDGRYKRLWTVTFMILDFDNDPSSYVVYETQHVINNDIPSPPTSPSRYGWIFDYWMLNNEEVNISRSIHNHTVYYSHWTRDIVKVTLDANGGSSASEIEVICGESINEPVATRTGNHLDGWYLNNEKVLFPLVVNDDITLIAYWNVIVTFASNDTTYSSSTILSGTVVSQPNNPSRTGYDFNYWMLDNQQFNFSNVISQDTTLVAKYTPITYNITYALNSGTNNSSNRSTYTINDSFYIYAPTRSGYYFDGWTGTGLSSATNQPYVSSGSTGDRSYTANWTILRTVTYKNNGSTWTTQSVRNGNTTSSPGTPPSNNGYYFVHWYQSSSSTAFNFSTAITSNITLTARHDVASYTITYYLNNGTNNSSNRSTYTINDSFYIYAPTRSGYYFDGWTGTGLSSATNQPYVSSGSYGNRSYTANWSYLYTVSFNSNGGSSVSSQQVASGRCASQPSSPTRNGYSFNYWTLNGSRFYFSTAITSNITLVASWTEVTYAVYYCDKDGSVKRSYTGYKYGSYHTVSLYSSDYSTYYHGGNCYAYPIARKNKSYSSLSPVAYVQSSNEMMIVSNHGDSNGQLYMTKDFYVYPVYCLQDYHLECTCQIDYSDVYSHRNNNKISYDYLTVTWEGPSTMNETISITDISEFKFECPSGYRIYAMGITPVAVLNTVATQYKYSMQICEARYNTTTLYRTPNFEDLTAYNEVGNYSLNYHDFAVTVKWYDTILPRAVYLKASGSSFYVSAISFIICRMI